MNFWKTPRRGCEGTAGFPSGSGTPAGRQLALAGLALGPLSFHLPERDLPSAGSFLTCPQQPGLGQAEAGRWELSLGLP